MRANVNTEPIIVGNDGETKAGFKFGDLHLYDFRNSRGARQVTMADYGLCVVGSHVALTEMCDGVRQPTEQFAPGDIVFIPAGRTISTAAASNTYNGTLIRIPAALLAQQVSPAARENFRVIRRCQTTGLAQALQQMQHNNQLDDFEPLLSESISLAIAKSISMLLSTNDNDKPACLSEQKRRRVMDFIDAKIGDQITVNMMADVAALSPYHFARAFKRDVGVPPVHYVWKKRVERAQRLLATRRMGIAEASAACGFSSQSHFTRAFKANTGTTPAVWMRANKKQLR